MDVEIASDDLAAFISLWKRRTRSWQGQRTREEEKVKRVGRIGETQPQTMKLYDDVPTKTSPGLGVQTEKMHESVVDGVGKCQDSKERDDKFGNALKTRCTVFVNSHRRIQGSGKPAFGVLSL